MLMQDVRVLHDFCWMPNSKMSLNEHLENEILSNVYQMVFVINCYVSRMILTISTSRENG